MCEDDVRDGVEGGVTPLRRPTENGDGEGGRAGRGRGRRRRGVVWERERERVGGGRERRDAKQWAVWSVGRAAVCGGQAGSASAHLLHLA